MTIVEYRTLTAHARALLLEYEAERNRRFVNLEDERRINNCAFGVWRLWYRATNNCEWQLQDDAEMSRLARVTL